MLHTEADGKGDQAGPLFPAGSGQVPVMTWLLELPGTCWNKLFRTCDRDLIVNFQLVGQSPLNPVSYSTVTGLQRQVEVQLIS